MKNISMRKVKCITFTFLFFLNKGTEYCIIPVKIKKKIQHPYSNALVCERNSLGKLLVLKDTARLPS